MSKREGGGLFGWCLPSNGVGHHTECIVEFDWYGKTIACGCDCHTKQEEK